MKTFMLISLSASLSLFLHAGQSIAGTESTLIDHGSPVSTNGSIGSCMAQIFLNGIPGHARCSGTVVAPNIILTAAHCLKFLNGWGEWSGGVIFENMDDPGGEIGPPTDPSTLKTFRSITQSYVYDHYDPGSGPATSYGDWALVKFAGPMPTNCTPIKLSTKNAKVGKNYIEIGHGINEDEAQLQNLMAVENTAIKSKSKHIVTLQEDFGGTTAGDSGGAVLQVNKDGSVVLVGVIVGATTVSFRDSSTSVSYFRRSIKKAINRMQEAKTN